MVPSLPNHFKTLILQPLIYFVVLKELKITSKNVLEAYSTAIKIITTNNYKRGSDTD